MLYRQTVFVSISGFKCVYIYIYVCTALPRWLESPRWGSPKRECSEPKWSRRPPHTRISCERLVWKYTLWACSYSLSLFFFYKLSKLCQIIPTDSDLKMELGFPRFLYIQLVITMQFTSLSKFFSLFLFNTY